MILVIGNLLNWTRDGRPVPDLDGFRFAPFRALDANLLRAVDPPVVLSALVGDDHDAMDVARRLAELGYRGRYRALAARLPNPDVVRREVRSAAPTIDFDLMLLGGED